MSIEFIEFQKRSDLNETVIRLRDDEDVLSIDVIENGRTLKVVRASDVTTEPEEPSGEPGEDEAGAATPEESSGAEEPSEDAEDLLGEVAPTPADDKPEITPETDRNTLREIVEQYGLDVDIPTAGPLQPLRDRIAAALAEK
jgi:hypothetical protein